MLAVATATLRQRRGDLSGQPQSLRKIAADLAKRAAPDAPGNSAKEPADARQRRLSLNPMGQSLISSTWGDYST
jgi:hypothetical protein